MHHPFVLCFFSERLERKVMRILEFQRCQEEDLVLAGQPYVGKMWKVMRRIRFYSLLVNQEMGGNIALLRKIKELQEGPFHGAKTLVFDPTITLVQKQNAGIEADGPIVFANNKVVLSTFFAERLVLDNGMLRRLDRAIFSPSPSLGQRPFHFPMFDTSTVFGFGVDAQEHDDDDDGYHLLEQTIEMSMRHPQPSPENSPRPEKRVKLVTGWKDQLKTPEEWPENAPDTKGRCCVCLAHRASICFVDCQHQVMCDTCIEEMYSRPQHAAKRVCPVCSKEVDQIVRPIL